MAKQQNWISQVEAWVICWGLVASIFERNRFLPSKHCKSFRLIRVILGSILEGFTDEVAQNPRLGSSESAANVAFRVADVRTTRILGFLSVNAIRQIESESDVEKTIALLADIHGTMGSVNLWGEAAIPAFLAYWLALRHRDASLSSDRLLFSLLDTLVQKITERSLYADPYVPADEFALAVAREDHNVIGRLKRYHSWALQKVPVSFSG